MAKAGAKKQVQENKARLELLKKLLIFANVSRFLQASLLTWTYPVSHLLCRRFVSCSLHSRLLMTAGVVCGRQAVGFKELGCLEHLLCSFGHLRNRLLLLHQRHPHGR